MLFIARAVTTKKTLLWGERGICFTGAALSGRSNISNTRDRVSSGYPNTEKRVENTTRSGVFLTKFEVFG